MRSAGEVVSEIGESDFEGERREWDGSRGSKRPACTVLILNDRMHDGRMEAVYKLRAAGMMRVSCVRDDELGARRGNAPSSREAGG